MNFEDHFSQRPETYAQYRPQYPRELFAFLAGQTPAHTLAWDCATGSGQAARGLVEFFDQVFATDASAEQINRAVHHDKITYRVEPAEQTSLDPSSVDLVTVAVAVHWFDIDNFYQEAQRVLKPGGIIAVWTYHRPVINPKVDQVIARLEDKILAGYWPERVRYLRDHYQTLPFPFDEISSPEFAIEAEWTLDQLLGFIESWSAVRRYEEEKGSHPLKSVWNDLFTAWGVDGSSQPIRYPLYLRVGRAKK